MAKGREKGKKEWEEKGSKNNASANRSARYENWKSEKQGKRGRRKGRGIRWSGM